LSPTLPDSSIGTDPRLARDGRAVGGPPATAGDLEAGRVSATTSSFGGLGAVVR
jgi:hypothetical protein